MGDGPGTSALFERFATAGKALANGMLVWCLAELPVAA
jgi:hypothetical protein